MRTVKYSKRFLRDYSKLKLSGRRKMEKLNKVLDILIDGQSLDPIHVDHALKGKWKGYRDCHIEGDWVLVYRVELRANGIETITFEATGNHSNLLK